MLQGHSVLFLGGGQPSGRMRPNADFAEVSLGDLGTKDSGERKETTDS